VTSKIETALSSLPARAPTRTGGIIILKKDVKFTQTHRANRPVSRAIGESPPLTNRQVFQEPALVKKIPVPPLKNCLALFANRMANV